jgi:hypothetical protein
MAGKPQLPDRLEMVARRRSARPPGQAFGEEVRPCVLEGRPRRDDAGGEKEG